jgi:hypothetical protein
MSTKTAQQIIVGINYEMRTTAMMETYRGIAWTADLILNDVKVGMIENYGDGGCDIVRFDKPIARKAWMAYVNERFDSNEELATAHLLFQEDAMSMFGEGLDD